MATWLLQTPIGLAAPQAMRRHGDANGAVLGGKRVVAPRLSIAGERFAACLLRLRGAERAS